MSMVMQFSGGSGTWTDVVVVRDCGKDTTDVETLTQLRRKAIWGAAKDTGYNYSAGRELIFDTQPQAEAVLNSYLKRVNDEKSFIDSITNCHTYHKP